MAQGKSNSEFQQNAMPIRGPQRNMQERVKVKNTKQTIMRLWGYLAERRVAIICAFILIAMYASLSVIATYMVRPIINGLLNGMGTAYLVKNLAIMFSIYAVAFVCSYLQTRLMLEIAQSSLARLRGDLFEKLQKLPIGYFDRTNNGDLMSRFTNDVDSINNMLSTTCVQLISGVITLATTVALMLYTSWILTVVMIVIVPLFTVVTKTISKKSMVMYKGQQKAIGDLNGFIEEHVSGQKVIKVFSHEEETVENFEKFNETYTEKYSTAQFVSGSLGPIMGGLAQLSYVIVASVGGFLCVLNGFDIGGYTIFVNYARSFARPINDIFMQINTIFAALAGAERVFEVIDEDPEEAISQDAKTTPIIGEVEFKNVDFSYIKGKQILYDLSVSAKKGEKVAFVGHTGAGKTTITNLLNRFYDIEGGNILIDGVDVKDYNRDYLRTNIAVVLQDTHLFSGSIYDNIRYARWDATKEEVEEAAKVACAHDFIIKLENGYDTQIIADSEALSQGQRQLLSIARTALSKAPILVLDEATSWVDTRTERQIQTALDNLSSGRTTFVIAHRLSTVRNADKIVVLDAGKIIDQGNHQELLAQKGTYFGLYSHTTKLQ